MGLAAVKKYLGPRSPRIHLIRYALHSIKLAWTEILKSLRQPTVLASNYYVVTGDTMMIHDDFYLVIDFFFCQSRLVE